MRPFCALSVLYLASCLQVDRVTLGALPSRRDDSGAKPGAYDASPGHAASALDGGLAREADSGLDDVDDAHRGEWPGDAAREAPPHDGVTERDDEDSESDDDGSEAEASSEEESDEEDPDEEESDDR